MQQELDQLRTNLAKIEESVEMKNKTARESRLHMVEITKQLANIGSGAAALEGVEQELSDAVSMGEGGVGRIAFRKFVGWGVGHNQCLPKYNSIIITRLSRGWEEGVGEEMEEEE